MFGLVSKDSFSPWGHQVAQLLCLLHTACVLQTFCLCFFFFHQFLTITQPQTHINLHKRIFSHYLTTKTYRSKKKKKRKLRLCLAKSFFPHLAAPKLTLLYVNVWFEYPLVALFLSQCIYWFTSILQNSSMFIKQLVTTGSVLDVKDHSRHSETNKQGNNGNSNNEL